jgi:carboxylesterase type B
MDYNGVMTTITTRLGVIEGANRNGVEQFLGIRHAEAPMGDHRELWR